MKQEEIDEKWEAMKSEIRDLRSKSELSAGLAAEVSKAEKARRLAGEIIATLYVNVERGNLPEALLERLDIWKNRLREYGG